MRLALNFQRVDPDPGGCRDLRGGPLPGPGRARATASTSTPRPGARARCLRGSNAFPWPPAGRTKLGRLWSFARNSEEALRQGSYDCTVGLINTWHHDVIIPQGGVHRGSLEANARRFPDGLAARTLSPGQDGQSQVLGPRGDRAPAVRRRAAGQGGRRQQPGQGASPPVPPRPPDPDPRDPQRDRPARLMVAHPGAVRCAFRNKMGLEPGDLVGLFVGHNYELKGLEPLLRGPGRAEAAPARGAADPPARLRRRQRPLRTRADRSAWD